MSERVIGERYRLERLLGAGATAEVWCAEDIELERQVALKLLSPTADRARFEREARAAAALSHPNICALYDFGKADERPFMVLEYLPGGTLEQRLARGRPLDDAETERVARELAAGLAHAHAQGVVHRDLKPANVLFDADGRAKIADFGIARLGEAGTLTEAGTLLGTAAYISPEQATGETATAASDVYAFGVILYRMLTGRLPFEAESALELVALHRDREPPPISSFRRDAPPRLVALAEAALAKDPAERPPDGVALVSALGGESVVPVAEAEVTQVIPIARPPSRRPSKRLPLALALVALLAVAGAATAILATHDDSPETRIAPNKSSARGTTRGTHASTTQRTTPRGSTAETRGTTSPTTQGRSTRPRPKPTTHTTPRTTAPPPTTSPPPPTTQPPPTTEPPPPTTQPPPSTQPPPTTTPPVP